MKEIIHEMFSEQEVDARIAEMGAQISKDLDGEPVVLICVLKGASFFACELAKRITAPVYMDFMVVSSYGNGTKSTGITTIKQDISEDIQGRNVLIVEDIIDSGNTLFNLVKMLGERKPKSIRLATLLDKPSRREVEVAVDYIGYQIPDEFVVGYGLDYAQRYRNLPYIGAIEFAEGGSF